MRIALIHYASHPVIGGVEQVMAAHARLFAEHGHDVLVISQRGEAAVTLPRSDTAACYADFLRPHLASCNVVFVHNVMTMPFDMALTEALAALAIEMPSVRFIAWVHDFAACNPDLAPVARELTQARPGFTYVAVSELRARQFRETIGHSCRVVPNGIDPAVVLGLTGEVAAFAQANQLLDGRTVLLHPTRLLRRKNVELGLSLMRAWKDLRHVGTLLITGAEDPHNPASREYAAFLKGESDLLELQKEVIFVGEHFLVGELDLAGLYRLADALFLPSRQEGFGLPVLEAAVHRLPAFLADVEPLRTLAGPDAWLFNLEMSPSKLAAWMLEKLIAHPPTLTRHRVLVSNGWESIYDRDLAPLLSVQP